MRKWKVKKECILAIIMALINDVKKFLMQLAKIKKNKELRVKVYLMER